MKNKNKHIKFWIAHKSTLSLNRPETITYYYVMYRLGRFSEPKVLATYLNNRKRAEKFLKQLHSDLNEYMIERKMN
jgi:hypothetical protein